jgi:hypothetical protein
MRQTSQPTTCFGLFQLGHIQVGHKDHRNYTIIQYNHLMIKLNYFVVSLTFMSNLKMA